MKRAGVAVVELYKRRALNSLGLHRGYASLTRCRELETCHVKVRNSRRAVRFESTHPDDQPDDDGLGDASMFGGLQVLEGLEGGCYQRSSIG